MSWRDRFAKSSNLLSISWFDLLVLGLLLVGGWIYLHNVLHWGVGWIGESEYGDAEFWWNGALHFAQGIFQDNPGKGFRPGYFILSGLTLPVLGSQFKQYYPYFLFLFLSVSSLFYLALRQLLGRWASAFVVAMLVFNPFTAEWLATSTTDGTGLLLNIAALTCLLLGVRKGLSLGWLVGFGILFSLATLTRPLVTPFIGIVILVLLTLPKASFKKRCWAVVFVLVAFCLPTSGWMVVQKMTIDRWAISSNDASAFYAASDPNIQVWSPTMYDHVQEIAANQYHLKPDMVTDQILNQIFWQETIKNYLNYPAYHLSRVVPHIWEVARFSPKRSTHGGDHWRTAFLEMIAAGLAIWLLSQQRRFRALLIIIVGFSIYFSPWIVTYLTLMGVLFALLTWRADRLGVFLLGAYWLTGVAALYFIGGTWGKPSFDGLFDLNALGYRLGSQVFFVGDLLAVYFMVWLAQVSQYNHFRWGQFIERPNPLAGNLVMGFFSVLVTATMLVYLIGSAVVCERIYSRHYAIAKSFPAMDQLQKIYKHHSGFGLVQGESVKGALNESAFSKLDVKTGQADVVFTGMVSSFIWNLPGQERAQLKVHTQNQIYPITMGPGTIYLDVPGHVDAKDWIGKQGAFVIRKLSDNYNKSNVAYYLTNPVLCAFVPLSSDGKSFESAKTVWFPVTKNATQLASDGELQLQHAKIIWSVDSGQALYQRRFFLVPEIKNNTSGRAKLILNVAKMHGPATLNFAYTLGFAPSATPTSLPNSSYDMMVSIVRKGSKFHPARLISDHNVVLSDKQDVSLKKITFPISADTQTVELAFNHVPPGTGIWIYEFNLSATALKDIGDE